MATTKLALPVALLICLCGLMVLGSIPSTGAKEGKMCPMYCLEANYTTCPSTGTQHLKPVCNCCMTNENGCTIYLANGGVQKCP
ncbi:hypothetical protein BS78_01G090800 [Paspalum vaginatum]|nr:hypothetical protein BS78_01G090800 [Paspalum vaginatum]